HSRAVAAERQFVTSLPRNRAWAIADHLLRVERMPPRAGTDAVDARCPHFRAAVAVGLAHLADRPADQSGDLDAHAVLTLETTTTRHAGAAREAVAHARRHVRAAEAGLIDQSTRAIANSLEA